MSGRFVVVVVVKNVVFTIIILIIKDRGKLQQLSDYAKDVLNSLNINWGYNNNNNRMIIIIMIIIE